jgi:hypothetical protein
MTESSLARQRKTPTLGTKSKRASKAKKLATVAEVLRADEVLLCTSAGDDWPQIDVKAVQAAVTSEFAAAPDQRQSASSLAWARPRSLT